MFIDFGFGILVLTLAVTLFSIAAALYGFYTGSPRWVESARRAMQLTFPLITLVALALIYLLVSGHYEVQFVYSVTSNEMPLYLKITALWGGQEGSLILWAWLLAVFTSAVTLRKWDRDQELLPWVIIVTAITLAFFLALVIFFENPFARWWILPDNTPVAAMFQPSGAVPAFPNNGEGLNPLLRHPGMIIHPPMLYLGFVAFVIPYAFAIAALVTGRTDDRWLRLTRRWTLIAWLFLSIGLVLGARWAYDVLGWGGYWGWDPVEIAAFMPWLTGTAFLHSVMIQEKRGLFKQWNMILVILTYSLVLFGTFLTRSGVLSSVHAFAQSAIGPMFFSFIGVTFITSLVLLFHRWKDLTATIEMKSMLSREALFLLNNLLFIGVLIICFWGVVSPLISELATGQKITVGPPFYERATSPLWGALMLLMGVAPLSAWGKSTFTTLGKALWKPALLAALTPLMLAALGMRNWVALLGFTLVALVIFVSLHEYWRGARARQKAQGEGFLTALARLAARNRRRYGGYIIHISMVIMAIGILGIEIFQTETQRNMAIGDQVELAGYTVRYDSLAQFPYSDGRFVTRAVMSVFKAGEFVDEIYPRYDLYPGGQPMTIPGVRSTLVDDLYVVLVNWENVSATQTPFKIYHNPLVNWLWIGSGIFILGYLLAAWPQKENG
ncbi:MAG: heme lyase CcmF/NrfE family subunit [Anaerolineales bacterium]|nr:heme lyase CcmF/NrfE family subunit [Anaerolineales bacterium]